MKTKVTILGNIDKIVIGHPKSEAEEFFYADCKSKNLIPIRTGWPDFMCVNSKTGKIVLIKIRYKHQYQRDNNKFIMRKFQEAGIETKVWNYEDFLKIHLTPKK